MAQFQVIDDLDLRNKTVLVRADLNVPVKEGHITDTTRLVRLEPTLRDLQKGGAKIVLLSHFGRPKGQRDPSCSLRPVAMELSVLLHETVHFADDCIGPAAERAVDRLASGEILVLENTRYYPEEEANDLTFAKKIAALGDYFINDAFSAAHRAHATTTTLAELLPSAAGRLMQQELTALNKALEHPQKPVAALVGGSKISTKLDLLLNLISKVDVLVLGGGMANTFMAAQGLPVGKSLYEADMLDTARAISTKAEAQGCAIILPKDVVVAAELKEGVASQIVAANAVPDDMMIFDIGPQSIDYIKQSVSLCRTLVWNGPLGVFEITPFNKGTNEVARYVADLSKRGMILSVAGGGDTVAALTGAGVANGISYLSTAGGAFLEWMEGKQLPGVEALRKNRR